MKKVLFLSVLAVCLAMYTMCMPLLLMLEQRDVRMIYVMNVKFGK